ncbi:MAG: acetyl-CoA carboxylase biotin carboxyl carrier protein subunit [Ignavibacteriales bacterium]|nr:acetyl-CoA carboxylase biotin carboxyl carrier protein subunit [Ignavibacteriales bacterium]
MDNINDFYKVIIDDTSYEAKLTPKFIRRKPYIPADPKKLNAILPGNILELCVKKGQSVKRGDKLLVFEAMKMKNTIISPQDFIIKTIHVKPGSMVAKGELLVEFE